MPERKGRKRKPARDRRRSGEAAVYGEGAPAPAARPAAVAKRRKGASDGGPLPSTFARVTGLMLATVTALLAAGMVYQGASGDAGGIDGIGRIVAGVLLIVLALVVGVLSVAPGIVRDWIQGRR